MAKLFTLAFAAAALVLTAGAPPPVVGGDEPTRQCFLPQTVSNYRTDGDTTAYLRAGRNEVYQLQSGGCRGLGASNGLSVVSRTGGGRACVGESIGLQTRGPSLRSENVSSCTARIVKRLSPEEVAALPSRVRP
jgi:hypothetical protein